jgi:hypothetical protein
VKTKKLLLEALSQITCLAVIGPDGNADSQYQYHFHQQDRPDDRSCQPLPYLISFWMHSFFNQLEFTQRE